MQPVDGWDCFSVVTLEDLGKASISMLQVTGYRGSSNQDYLSTKHDFSQDLRLFLRFPQ